MSRECSCPRPEGGRPFVCPTWRRTFTDRHWQICSGQTDPRLPVVTPTTRMAYLALWAGAPERAAVARPPRHGPGTELKALLAELGIQPDGCDCEKRARQMDRWGVDGCRERFGQIVVWLRGEYERRGWVERVKAAALAVVTGLAVRLDPRDVIASLVEESLRRAEQKAREAVGPP